MKFIFDFDDVLFHNTEQFKKHMYMCLEKGGISQDIAREYYKTVRANQFWLKDMLTHFSLPESLYEEILKESKNFINHDVLNIVKKMKKENCYIVTHGNENFQKDKIKNAGIEDLFLEIIVVSDSKKEAIEKICLKHKDEEVVFIDDKVKHLENLDFKKCPNLKTILFDEEGLSRLRFIIP
ncbi:MAG: HAD family hydrolase [Candidatus Parcubacteria bacterium]|nr:HAD family hydrolase [Candidatus Parcubacteria bacterium]